MRLAFVFLGKVLIVFFQPFVASATVFPLVNDEQQTKIAQWTGEKVSSCFLNVAFIVAAVVSWFEPRLKIRKTQFKSRNPLPFLASFTATAVECR